MKEDQCTKHVAKSQVCAVFHLREIFGKMFYPNLQSFVWRRHVVVPLRGTNMATGNQTTH